MSISSLGQGVSDISAYEKAQHASRLSAPVNCYFQGITLPQLMPQRVTLENPELATLNEKLPTYLPALITSNRSDYRTQQSLTAEQLTQTSLFLGSSSMDIGAVVSDKEKAIWLTYLDHLNQYLNYKIWTEHSLNFTFSSACTSSANALIYARSLTKNCPD